MKRTVICLCLALVSLTGFSQPGHFHPEKLNDDEIIKMQVRDIVYWLNLDGETKDKFVEEYTSFKKEIDAVAKSALPPRHLEDENEIDKAIQNNFAVSGKILEIRKKYYARFREFLKPSQIQMMYHLERESGRRMFEGPGKHREFGSPDGPRPNCPACPDGPRPSGPDCPNGNGGHVRPAPNGVFQPR